jgi:hypothetical protein
MNQASRKRLVIVANRLILNNSANAGLDRTNCCFCDQPIRALDEYKKSGGQEAHVLCVKPILSEIKV